MEERRNPLNDGYDTGGNMSLKLRWLGSQVKKCNHFVLLMGIYIPTLIGVYQLSHGCYHNTNILYPTRTPNWIGLQFTHPVAIYLAPLPFASFSPSSLIKTDVCPAPL